MIPLSKQDGVIGMLGRLLAMIIGIAGIVGGSQAPNFTQNFMQNLEGRVDERRIDFQRITQRWSEFGLSRDNVGDNCVETTVPGSNSLQSCLEDEWIVDRFEVLQGLQAELQSTEGWRRPIVLGQALMENQCRGIQGEGPSDQLQNLCLRPLAENTLKEFEVAVPATAEGMGYGAAGGGVLWILSRLLFGLIGLPFRPRYS